MSSARHRLGGSRRRVANNGGFGDLLVDEKYEICWGIYYIYIYIYIYEFSVFKMKNSSCLLVHKEASVDISNYIIWTFPF